MVIPWYLPCLVDGYDLYDHSFMFPVDMAPVPGWRKFSGWPWASPRLATSLLAVKVNPIINHFGVLGISQSLPLLALDGKSI